MDQEFKIGEVVDVVDYVDDQQVYARGVIKDCWFSHTFDEVIYSPSRAAETIVFALAFGEFVTLYRRAAGTPPLH